MTVFSLVKSTTRLLFFSGSQRGKYSKMWVFYICTSKTPFPWDFEDIPWGWTTHWNLYQQLWQLFYIYFHSWPISTWGSYSLYKQIFVKGSGTGWGMFVRIVIKVVCVPELEENEMCWILSPLWLCYFERLINLSGPHLAHVCVSLALLSQSIDE